MACRLSYIPHFLTEFEQQLIQNISTNEYLFNNAEASGAFPPDLPCRFQRYSFSRYQLNNLAVQAVAALESNPNVTSSHVHPKGMGSNPNVTHQCNHSQR